MDFQPSFSLRSCPYAWFITNQKSDANWLNLGFILPFDFSVLALSIIVDALLIKTSGTPPMISDAESQINIFD